MQRSPSLHTDASCAFRDKKFPLASFSHKAKEKDLCCLFVCVCVCVCRLSDPLYSLSKIADSLSIWQGKARQWQGKFLTGRMGGGGERGDSSVAYIASSICSLLYRHCPSCSKGETINNGEQDCQFGLLKRKITNLAFFSIGWPRNFFKIIK